MSEGDKEIPDPQVARMLRARDSSATLKLELVTLRSRLPNALIFVFEGPEDKVAFAQWIRRLRPDLRYEPHPCKGKGNLLSLRMATLRDVNGLSSGVFFFVDKDFDELRGQPADPSTFMTETYSIENVLADRETVEQLLVNEFHCHGNPGGRDRIVALYEKCYDQFLLISKESNLRLLAIDVLKINGNGYVAGRIGQLATVAVDEVARGSMDPDKIVPLQRELSDEERASLIVLLESLNPKLHYRGKFAFLFLTCWLSKLAASRAENPKLLFDGMDLTYGVNPAEFGVALLASRSPSPRGLEEFLSNIKEAA